LPEGNPTPSFPEIGDFDLACLKANRFEPELGFVLGGFHMNVRRLISLVAEEEKAKPADP
jgi:hypothetical protein